MTIAVDFDGTIVEHKYPKIGKELPFAIDTLKTLAEEGHKLILWTSRDGELLEEALKFCRDRGLEFYAVNSNYPPGALFTNKAGKSCKVVADVYIDDRNIGGLPDWGQIYQMISHGTGWKDLVNEASRKKFDQHEAPKKKHWWSRG